MSLGRARDPGSARAPGCARRLPARRIPGEMRIDGASLLARPGLADVCNLVAGIRRRSGGPAIYVSCRRDDRWPVPAALQWQCGAFGRLLSGQRGSRRGRGRGRDEPDRESYQGGRRHAAALHADSVRLRRDQEVQGMTTAACSAANLAHSAFVSLFPLLLVLVTAASGWSPPVDPAFQARTSVNAVAGQVPLIGHRADGQRAPAAAGEP